MSADWDELLAPQADVPATQIIQESATVVAAAAMEAPEPNPEPAGTPETPATEVASIPEPTPEPPDLRQRWVCVEPTGPRHQRRSPTGNLELCPPFHSDTHLSRPPELVVCPTCGSWSVRRALPGE